jgi:hypothetical protein
VNHSISAVAALVASLPAAAAAQLPQASAAALGMGFNMTASARGSAAVANNPAGLGRESSPGLSLAIPSIAVESGLGPVELSDLAKWDTAVIPDPAKAEWFARITDSGGQAGAPQVRATPIALSIGPIGFQLSSMGAGDVSLAPDAAELLLYGNAGRTGTVEDFTLTGSEVDGFWLSTAAPSVGFHVASGLHVGRTGKYTIGNGLLVGRDVGSSVDSLGVELDFPVLLPRTDDPAFDHDTGYGFDVGALWERPTFALGATVRNVVHTFEWKLDDLSYVPGQALFNQDSATSNVDEQPASAAPSSLLDIVAARRIEPILSVAAEWRPQ